jgi:outer membrane protein OmpA-like peptidoglycan-associated protein
MTMRKLSHTFVIMSTLVGFAYVASADDKNDVDLDVDADLDVDTDLDVDVDKGLDSEHKMQRVFFEFDSDKPTDDLLTVANNLQCNPKETIILDAYADPTGPAKYNADLSMRRAQKVREALVSMGIDNSRIMVAAFGEQGDRAPTDQQNRRVEIRTSEEPVATLQARRAGEAIAVVAPGEQPEQIARP